MAKIWFLTGASSGFGNAFTEAILAKGDKVAATFRKEEQARAFTRKHIGHGIGLVLDVTNPQQVKEAVQHAQQEFGTIDVLVNNAGYGTVGAIEEFTMEEIRQQMETNFFGMAALTKEVLPLMREQGSGHIIQMSSVSGIRAMGGFGVYNASKFALEGFSEALAQEVAPFGIKVTIVEPGPFRTEFAGGSIKRPHHRLDVYKEGPVANMYKYIEGAHGTHMIHSSNRTNSQYSHSMEWVAPDSARFPRAVALARRSNAPRTKASRTMPTTLLLVKGVESPRSSPESRKAKGPCASSCMASARAAEFFSSGTSGSHSSTCPCHARPGFQLFMITRPMVMATVTLIKQIRRSLVPLRSGKLVWISASKTAKKMSGMASIRSSATTKNPSFPRCSLRKPPR